MRKIIKVGLLLLALGLLIIIAAITTVKPEPVNVNVEVVQARTIKKSVIVSGKIKTEDPIYVNIPYGVVIDKLLVSNGQYVSEGTPLASVDVPYTNKTMYYLKSQMNSLSQELHAMLGGSYSIDDDGHLTVKGTQLNYMQTESFSKYLNLLEQFTDCQEEISRLAEQSESGFVYAKTDGIVQNLDYNIPEFSRNKSLNFLNN